MLINKRTFLKLLIGTAVTPYVSIHLPEQLPEANGYLKVYLETSKGEFVYEAPYMVEVKGDLIKINPIRDLVIQVKDEIYIKSISVSIPKELQMGTRKSLWQGFVKIPSNNTLTIEWNT